MKAVIETRKSKSAKQIEKELKVFNKLSNLFDIVRNEELLPVSKKRFLVDQRSLRNEIISDHLVFSLLNQPSTSNQPSPSNQPSTSQLPSRSISIDEQEESFSDNFEFSDATLDFDHSPDFVPPTRNGKKISLCHDDLVGLSKCGGSYRVMEKVLSIGIKAAGKTPNDYAISRATLCNQLTQFRSNDVAQVFTETISDDSKVVIHFDEKEFTKINQKHIGKDSRLVVLGHTQTDDIALGLPILQSKTAESINNEIVGLCENFGLLHRVVALACDTTAVNTGELSGVRVRFEEELEKDVLSLTCRHHILEVLLSAVFRSIFGEVEAPTVTIFDQLKADWNRIKENGFQYNLCSQAVLQSFHLRPFFDDAKQVIIGHSKSKSIRDDYAELNDLCLKFMGIKTTKSFMVPSSISKARWMAKAIYAIKMYLFRNELDIDDELRRDLREFSLFVVLIYCKYWNRCTIAVDAATNDLNLIKELQSYADYNEDVSLAALNAFNNHLWYLGIVEKIPYRGENSIRLKEQIDGLELHNLVTERSGLLFSLLNIDTNFFEKDANRWNRDPEYRRAKKLVADLIIVVNDRAERAIGRAVTIIRNQKARSEARFQNLFKSLVSNKNLSEH